MKRFLVLFCSLMIIPAAALSAGGSKESRPLRIAYQDRVGDAAAILSAEELTGDPAFSFTRLSSGSLTAEALISGNADLATMGDAVAVSLASRYPETVVLLGVHGAGAERHQLVSATDRPQTIGVKFGTSTHAALLAWLDYEPKLIDLSPDLQTAALASGEIDGLAASEPTPSIALSRIDGVRAYPLSSEGRSFPLVLAASRTAVSQSPERIAKYIESLRESSGKLVGGVDEASLQRLSEVTALDPSVLRSSLAHHTFSFEPIELHLAELQELAGFLEAEGKIPSAPDWERVTDLD